MVKMENTLLPRCCEKKRPCFVDLDSYHVMCLNCTFFSIFYFQVNMTNDHYYLLGLKLFM